ncbi:hypothetical protein [Psychroflexus aestuariivivens]|uniref:hypothetical protein n=1 Tax=Psychroflexus aestuariivivens TaxID=1795040 RepID=UPI000FD9856A|nr:hypothetical protein [Psychroflexus aestuariivivens]
MTKEKSNKQLNNSEINQKAEQLEKIKNKVKFDEKLSKKENEIYQNYLSIVKKFPPVYENTPYGDLKQLYDIFKAHDFNKMNDIEKQSFKIELDELVNGLIDFIKTVPMTSKRFTNVINRLKYLYTLYYDVDVFNETDKKRIERNDAFDFELEPKAKPDGRLLITDAEKRILKAIDEVKAKHNPKGSSKEYAEYQKLFKQQIPDAAFDELMKLDAKYRITFMYLTGDLLNIYNDNGLNAKKTAETIESFIGTNYSNAITPTIRRNPAQKNFATNECIEYKPLTNIIEKYNIKVNEN